MDEPRIIEIDFLAPNHGSMPIGRYDGKVCLIQKGIKGFFEYGSTWEVEIIEEKERCFIIKPIECFRSAAFNKVLVGNKVKDLKVKFGGIDKSNRRVKLKKNFRYKNKQEILLIFEK